MSNKTTKFMKRNITTERLTLRPFALGDEEAVLRIFGYAEAKLTCNIGINDIEDACTFIYGTVYLGRNTNLVAIERRDNGEVIGAISCYDMPLDRGCHADHPTTWVIGYVLDKDMWNKGYATEIVRGVISNLFENGHAERVLLNIADWNWRSKHVARKCGFERMGENKRGGHIYQATRENYFTTRFTPRFDDDRKNPAVRIQHWQGMPKGEDIQIQNAMTA